MAENIQSQNALSAYFRAPKMYTTIPSGGRFYGPEILESTDNNEYPVFPMTTKDELMLKNPDALLNGDAVASLIKSCLPAVQQPKSLFSADVDALLIAMSIPLSAETNPMLLSASNKDIEFEIFLILNFGRGLISFFCILSQYIFNLVRPCDWAPTNSAYIIASEQIFECFADKLQFLKIFEILFFNFKVSLCNFFS